MRSLLRTDDAWKPRKRRKNRPLRKKQPGIIDPRNVKQLPARKSLQSLICLNGLDGLSWWPRFVAVNFLINSFLSIAFSSLATIALQGSPAQPETNDQYQDCITMLSADPDLGRRIARQWVSDGGGPDALHCLSISDLKSGLPKMAAIRLTQISERNDAGEPLVRARILAQAAEAWLSAGEVAEAKLTIDKAFKLAPKSGELHQTAAKIYFADEKWSDVISAVSKAEKAGFKSVDGFILRARAYKTFGNLEFAAEDVVSALTLDPYSVDALVLRGELDQAGVSIEVYYDRPAK